MILTVIFTAVVLLATTSLFMGLFATKWDPKGKHCYVTGGSTGLGLALAILLTKKGADVSIVARDEKKLDIALAELEKARQTPSQVLKSYSYSLTDAQLSVDALEAACAAHGGRTPDAVFLCAGASQPRFFVESEVEDLQRGMDNGFWVQAHSAWAAAKRMVRTKTQGKIILVGSILSYFSMVGYTSYSPAKHALRGLAESLRSEMLLYNISVHMYFPATIYSPGYEAENKTKPKITLKIEETDEGQKPEDCAKGLLQGVINGNFHINSELLGNLFRASTRGTTPYNNVFMDTIYSLIGLIGLPIWRSTVDKQIIAHRQEHEEYLTSRGFFA